jgi:hypothetical protein
LHGLEIYNVNSVIGCRPQPVEVIFDHFPYKVALKKKRGTVYIEIYEFITIVSRQTSSLSGHPDESMAVFEYIVYKIYR